MSGKSYKAVFRRQTNVGKLKIGVCERHKNMLVNCWRPIELVASFTCQTNFGKLVLANSNWCVWTTQQRVGKLLAKNRTCLYSRQLFANSLPTCVWRVKAACFYSRQQFANLLLCRSHTPIWVCQHELANISLTCEGRFTISCERAQVTTAHIITARAVIKL